ncbi:hypothetical protein FHG87_006215 [Trinorchestia longiramus]|nr:hypothetical protein FHG87_006215 [Trinorchestia longiramus]
MVVAFVSLASHGGRVGNTWRASHGGHHMEGITCIFNVPASCLPSPKPAPRPAKVEDQQLRYFLQKNKITSFDDFKPEPNLQKQYKNLIISRSKERLVCLFINGYFSECSLSVIVENKPTLCSPLALSAFENGISVPLFKTLHPNNGLRSYTQFDETVRFAMNYDIPFDKPIQNVVTLLQARTSACVHTEKEKKLVFLTHQSELLLQKQFFMNDYCFALQSYPKCNYEQLRDFLVLPCKRKLQYITSSIEKDQVLRETFDNVQTLQLKNAFLLVDETDSPNCLIFWWIAEWHGREQPRLQGHFYSNHLVIAVPQPSILLTTSVSGFSFLTQYIC